MHSFPKDTVKLNRLIEILKLGPDFKYKSTNCVICTRHLLHIFYTITFLGHEELEESSVPSIVPASSTVNIDLNTDNVNEHLIISTISDISRVLIG